MKTYTRHDRPIFPYQSIVIIVLVFAAFTIVSQFNFLFFHSIAEGFSIVIGFSIFVIAWNVRKLLANHFLLFLGIAFLFIGVLDSLHTITYKGMGVFLANDANTPTQLWIAARYLESIIFLAAPLFFTRKINTKYVFIVFITATSLVLVSIFYYHNFPICFIDGSGLTAFKKNSEYVICFILLAALWHLISKRDLLSPVVLYLIAASLVSSVISELFFTFYVSVYGLSNILGHYFKIISVYCLYKAIIETGLSQPYTLLFKELKDREQAFRKSERRLEKSENRFRHLYEYAPLPYQSLDYNGYFIDVNQAWLDTLGGYTKAEVVGRSFGDFLLPEWVEHFKLNFPRFKDKGEILGIEFEMVKKDGSTILVHFNGKVGYDEKGNMSQTHCIFQDITQQRKIEEQVRNSKEEWEKTFDAMHDIVTIQDKNMRIVRANKAAYQFFEEAKYGKLNGKYCYDLFTGKPEPCPGCPITGTLSSMESHSAIMTHENLGKTFQVSTSVITSEDGELQYLVHVAKDITEQIRLEKELFQAHKMEAIGTLAGGIAHDFNNILSAIIGFSELAKADLPAGSNATKDIDQVLVSSKRAAGLVQQILTFSRKSDHQLEPIAPYLIIREALKMLRSSLPTTIAIQEDIDTECGKIMADPTNIHQIIVNLCTNSLHAMEDEKGVLKVSLQRKDVGAEEITVEKGVSPGPFIVLEVNDTGQGMNKETRDRVFEPYFTTKEVGKGTGLGLAVIHGIVQDYHGFIRVKSELGKGTTFSIHIPALQQEILTTNETETTEPLPTGTERILVVDDESIIVSMNKTILERLGYKVSATINSLDALEKIRTDPDQFDLIITDQTMPNLTGAELAQEILKIKHTIPIILFTGYSSVLTEEDALVIGIKKYVRKPVNRTILAQLVRQVLDEN